VKSSSGFTPLCSASKESPLTLLYINPESQPHLIESRAGEEENGIELFYTFEY